MQKIAFVSGATKGIGLKVAQKLFNNGYKVIITGRSESVNLPDFTYIKCDISKKNQREAALLAAEKQFGKIDLLVNNAGVACEKRLDILETSEESFDRLIEINTKGTFFMCQAFASKMIEWQTKFGAEYNPRIINIGSISAYASSPSRGEYCISKAGVAMITKLFADRLAEHGIPVFEVRPGIIKTAMTEPVKDKYDKLIAGGITPIKRWGTPEDVADCVFAAASGLIDFGTGTVLNADGGFHLRRL